MFKNVWSRDSYKWTLIFFKRVITQHLDTETFLNSLIVSVPDITVLISVCAFDVVYGSLCSGLIASLSKGPWVPIWML